MAKVTQYLLSLSRGSFYALSIGVVVLATLPITAQYLYPELLPPKPIQKDSLDESFDAVLLKLIKPSMIEINLILSVSRDRRSRISSQKSSMQTFILAFPDVLRYFELPQTNIEY